MAKKDGKKKRIPKKIGDVKIPKELRQAGEALLDKANSPAGREIIATGLTIAAAAAATALRKDHGQEGKSDPQRMADAVSGMADAVFDRIFGGKKA